MMKKRFLSVVFLASLALMLSACEKTVKPVTPVLITGATMGTTYLVKFLPQPNLPIKSTMQTHIDALLEGVNNEMSTYRKDAKLSQFNAQKSTKPFPVSPDLSKVIVEAIRINDLSRGALDVTLGPLVNLWGFGPEGRPEKVPSDEEIAKRRAMTGIHFLTVGKDHIIKTKSTLYVDLSSIAKGFAVDKLSLYMFDLGIQNFMIEIGGELQLNGMNAYGNPWRIAIEKPSSGDQRVQEIIAPGDMGMATSGDYRNYFEENGVRYSHTIDPKTGKPITHKLASVTVLNKSCMTADALSTAFMVMGVEKALELANKEDIPAFFIVKTDNGFKEIVSNAFKQYQPSADGKIQGADQMVVF